MDEEQKKLAEELLFSEKKKLGFAKCLFFGDFEPGTVFPFPLALSENDQEVRLFLTKVQDFSENVVDPYLNDKNASLPEEVISGLKQLGVMGMTAPKDLGGLGMNFTTYCKVTEILSSRCGSTALFVNVHQSIGLKALLLFGTQEQRNHWLPKLASGNVIAAFALTEPSAGSDAAAVKTRAVYNPETNSYTINGTKRWITNGSVAGFLTLMAKMKMDTPDGVKDKITAFVVSPDMPGFRVVDPALEKVGFKGTKTAVLEFENMEVPAANVMGEVGGGLKVALTLLDYGRTTFGALCTGAAKYLVKRAVQHAKERYQFNRPIGSFSLVKEKISRISSLLYAMEATTYLTAGLIDRDVEDIMLETAILKVFASESLWTIIYDTMQIFGGKSLFSDEPFERMMRDARLNMIGEGSNEVLRAFIAAVGIRNVGMGLKDVLNELKNPLNGITSTTSFIKDWFSHLSKPDIPVKSKLLKEESLALGKMIQQFGHAVIKTLVKYGEAVVDKQLDLNRLTTIAIDIYTTTAVLSKLDHELETNQNKEKIAQDLEVGKFYCHLAMKNAQNMLDHLFEQDDEKIEKLSDLITGIRES